ncbi:MAG: Unknown protein [uncultured Sulfurovum sp.]|uniref:Uncharacterized protein n=1 Tax=uncultured Sulfurovum sp. TaxID=269237 RepID=A0A6S6SCK4_9BACT|nr:MAG: Unknown protein [uncultured Sulfurovum sp.]
MSKGGSSDGGIGIIILILVVGFFLVGVFNGISS